LIELESERSLSLISGKGSDCFLGEETGPSFDFSTSSSSAKNAPYYFMLL